MKKRIVALFVLSLFNIPVLAATDEEILFRNVPWKTSYAEVKETLTEFDLHGNHGDTMDRRPLREVIEDNRGSGAKEFPLGGINIIARPFSNYEIQVAGYTTSNVQLFFAYTPDGDILPQDNEHSALYAARYEFEPMDLNTMANDLKTKLASLYGEPDDEKSRTDSSKREITCTYWNGANDSQVVLTTFDTSKSLFSFSKDELWIAYVYQKGDELLHIAEDTLSAQRIREENAIAESNNTDGL